MTRTIWSGRSTAWLTRIELGLEFREEGNRTDGSVEMTLDSVVGHAESNTGWKTEKK